MEGGKERGEEHQLLQSKTVLTYIDTHVPPVVTLT